jgi:hypothetical protein
LIFINLEFNKFIIQLVGIMKKETDIMKKLFQKYKIPVKTVVEKYMTVSNVFKIFKQNHYLEKNA